MRYVISHLIIMFHGKRDSIPKPIAHKNPLSCWNSEEQDRGDVPLPREVRGDNDMDTGDAFALLRYSDR